MAHPVRACATRSSSFSNLPQPKKHVSRAASRGACDKKSRRQQASRDCMIGVVQKEEGRRRLSRGGGAHVDTRRRCIVEAHCQSSAILQCQPHPRFREPSFLGPQTQCQWATGLGCPAEETRNRERTRARATCLEARVRVWGAHASRRRRAQHTTTHNVGAPRHPHVHAFSLHFRSKRRRRNPPQNNGFGCAI